VVPVVHPDADDLSRLRHGREQADLPDGVSGQGILVRESLDVPSVAFVR
jgi:hypothetical protein